MSFPKIPASCNNYITSQIFLVRGINRREWLRRCCFTSLVCVCACVLRRLIHVMCSTCLSGESSEILPRCPCSHRQGPPSGRYCMQIRSRRHSHIIIIFGCNLRVHVFPTLPRIRYNLTSSVCRQSSYRQNIQRRQPRH